ELEIVASDAKQCVALFDDALEFACLAAMCPLDRREHRVAIAPARARLRAKESDVLGEERDDHELPREVVRALSRAVEQIPARPPALALGRREEHELDAPLPLGSIDLDPHPRGH